MFFRPFLRWHCRQPRYKTAAARQLPETRDPPADTCSDLFSANSFLSPCVVPLQDMARRALSGLELLLAVAVVLLAALPTASAAWNATAACQSLNCLNGVCVVNATLQTANCSCNAGYAGWRCQTNINVRGSAPFWSHCTSMCMY
jgi:hypothetical protein